MRTTADLQETKTALEGTPAHHEIDVELVNDEKGRHAVPHLPSSTKKGDFLHYRSSAGMVTVKFTDLDISPAHSQHSSPFVNENGEDLNEVCSTGPPLELTNLGTFIGRCYITLETDAASVNASPTIIGWSEDSPESGGNVVVK